MIEDVQKHDQGTYTCTCSNKENNSATGSIDLKIIGESYTYVFIFILQDFLLIM